MKPSRILGAVVCAAALWVPQWAAAQSISSFTVVNADTGAEIATFQSRGTVSMALTPNINIRANASSTKSVVFSDATTSRTENSVPYAYKGDSPKGYNSWRPVAGQYAINAQPFAGKGGSGTAGAVATLTLTVIAEPPPPLAQMPVFLLAGQSNMVGNIDQALFQNLLAELTTGPSASLQQRLADRLRQWYFEWQGGYATYGYSEPMAAFEASELVRLRAAGLVGNALVQQNPNVMCANNDTAVAPLTINCGNSFGPELMLGQVLGKTLPTPTSLIKVARGGTTLAVDWASPLAGRTVGDQYKQLSARIQSLRQNPASVHPDCAARSCQWAAFVWFQGENDSFDSAQAQAYEQNLRHLIADVRNEVGSAALPVVVVQVGRWAQGLPHGLTVAAAQQTVARSDQQTRLVDTLDLSGFYHYDPAAQLIIGERVAKAVKELLEAAR